MAISGGGQSAVRETVLCGPRALTEIETPIMKQPKTFYFCSALSGDEK